MTESHLKRIPFDVARWSDWKSLYPDTLVLTTDTGFSRAYSSDPYGDYYTDSKIIFPVENKDDPQVFHARSHATAQRRHAHEGFFPGFIVHHYAVTVGTGEEQQVDADLLEGGVAGGFAELVLHPGIGGEELDQHFIALLANVGLFLGGVAALGAERPSLVIRGAGQGDEDARDEG